jgi:hypothetical protein
VFRSSRLSAKHAPVSCDSRSAYMRAVRSLFQPGKISRQPPNDRPMPSQSVTGVALVSVRFLTQFREKFRGREASPVRRHVDRGCLCGWTDVRDLGAVLDHELPHSCARSGPVNQPLAGMVVGTRTDRLCGSDFNASGWPDLRWRPTSGGVAPARGGGARHE